MAYHRQQGVDTAIVRIFNTFGSRMRPNDGRAIPTFLRQALAEKPLTVFGDGSQTRSFCFVDDLIRGLILLAESGEHMPMNIGNPEERSLLELAEIVIALLIASRPFSPRLSAIGSIGAIGMFITTISFLVTTPGTWVVVEGFAVPGAMGAFIIKDVFLLGAAAWSAGEALRSARGGQTFS